MMYDNIVKNIGNDLVKKWAFIHDWAFKNVYFLLLQIICCCTIYIYIYKKKKKKMTDKERDTFLKFLRDLKGT